MSDIVVREWRLYIDDMIAFIHRIEFRKRKTRNPLESGMMAPVGFDPVSRKRTIPMIRLAAAALLASLIVLVGFSRADDTPDADLEAKALKLNSLRDLPAMNKQLVAIMKDKVEAKKLLDAAVKLHKAGGAGKSPFKYNAGLVLGKVARNLRDNKSAEIFYEVAFDNAVKLQSDEKILNAVDSLVEVLWLNKKYDKAEEAIKKVLDVGGKEIEDSQVGLSILLAKTKAKQGDADAALNMIDSLGNLDKEGTTFLRIKAEMLAELGKNEEAVATMQEVVDKTGKNRKIPKEDRVKLVRRLEYQLTAFYVDAKQIDKATEILERLIKFEPEVATYYNDLGFILADNDQRLDESEKLVRKALELDGDERKKLFDDGKITEAESEKENSSYVDSLGWVLYKRGKYDEARKYLLKASKDENQGAHLEIWDHLADCLMKLNKKDEALKVWTEALTFDDESRRDIERRKKVEAKVKALKAELKK